MSILEQLEKSLSPELIGAGPFCDFFTKYRVKFFFFVLHSNLVQHHYQAWANWITDFLLLCLLFKCFFYFALIYRSGAALRVVHRKALLEALAEELPKDTIRFSSKLTSIRTKANKGSSIALIQMEDGTTIRAKVTTNLSVQLSNTLCKYYSRKKQKRKRKKKKKSLHST